MLCTLMCHGAKSHKQQCSSCDMDRKMLQSAHFGLAFLPLIMYLSLPPTTTCTCPALATTTPADYSQQYWQRAQLEVMSTCTALDIAPMVAHTHTHTLFNALIAVVWMAGRACIECSCLCKITLYNAPCCAESPQHHARCGLPAC